jgi:hypothetical protein
LRFKLIARRIDTHRTHQGGHATGTGDGHDTKLRGVYQSDQARSRVTHTGCSRVTDVGNAFASSQTLHDQGACFAFVVLVQGDEWLFQAVGCQQILRVPGIFTRNGIHLRQRTQCAQTDVCKVTDWRGHHSQGGRGVVLARSSLLRGRKRG